MAKEGFCEIAYMGKKNPKIVELIKGKKYTFAPFKAVEVDNETAGKLLLNAGDIFKRVDKDERSPDPKPIPRTDGHVGDLASDEISPEQRAAEEKAEQGKDLDDITEEEKQKVADRRAARAENKGKNKDKK